MGPVPAENTVYDLSILDSQDASLYPPAGLSPICQYEATDPQKPKLTGVTPTTLTVAEGPNFRVTLNGTDFAASGNVVMIGSSACTIVSESTTTITCDSTSAAGAHKIELYSKDKGYAAGDFSVTTVINADVSGVNNGSFAGGHVVTLTGAGLGIGSTVTICGANCPVVSATGGELTCTVPPMYSTFSRDTAKLSPDMARHREPTYYQNELRKDPSFPLANVHDLDLATSYQALNNEGWVGV
ncbi:MAG: IPT/TIG domain-containing protein [Kangiellaceae bacterium]|nr:IPT/TIG domain-containing protein [Kangiellaceae bacterium]